MKGQVKTTKFTGEERVHSDGGSLFKKFFEKASKPSLISIDSIKSANKTIASETKNQGKLFATEAISQFFGIELTAGKPHSLSQKSESGQSNEKKSETPMLTSEHLNYFSEFKRVTEKGNDTGETAVIRSQLDAILSELRKLKDSSDELENVFKDVTIDAPPEKPGIYHLTFYEGFLKLVMKMRDKVQDGVTYAKLFRSRKQERSYHAMAKKGGTSFTMHHDRAVATQTG